MSIWQGGLYSFTAGGVTQNLTISNGSSSGVVSLKFNSDGTFCAAVSKPNIWGETNKEESDE